MTSEVVHIKGRRPRDLVPLDKTGGAGRYRDKMMREIERDLGGRRNLTRIERELVSAFVGSAVTLRYLNQQIDLGDTSAVDLTGYSTTASTMLRIGSRLGLKRRKPDDTPDDPLDYAAAHHDEASE